MQVYNVCVWDRAGVENIKLDENLVITQILSLTHNARNKRNLTRICRPALWLAWRERPSSLRGPPWCPRVQCLDCRSKHWPGADLRRKNKATFKRHAWRNVDMHEQTWNAALKSPSVGAEEADLHPSHQPASSRGCLTLHVLIQFLTLRKLCWLVRSNISRKPMASLKNAVVRLRNLKTDGVNCDLRHCEAPGGPPTYYLAQIILFSIAPPIGSFLNCLPRNLV